MTRSGPLDWLRASQDLKKHEFSKPLRSEKKTNVQLGERSPKVSSEALQKETWTAKVYHLIWIYQPPFGEPCKPSIATVAIRTLNTIPVQWLSLDEFLDALLDERWCGLESWGQVTRHLFSSCVSLRSMGISWLPPMPPPPRLIQHHEYL